MKISRNRIKEIVRETIVEENEYQAFFQKCLAKAGKSIPNMGEQEKKDFFNKIDSAWNSKGEKRGNVKEKVLPQKSRPVFESSKLTKLLRKAGWAGESKSPAEFKSQISKLPDNVLIMWSNDKNGIPNTPLAFQQKLVGIEMKKRGLKNESVNEYNKKDGIQVEKSTYTNGTEGYGGFVRLGKYTKVIPVIPGATEKKVRTRANKLYTAMKKWVKEDEKKAKAKEDKKNINEVSFDKFTSKYNFTGNDPVNPKTSVRIKKGDKIIIMQRSGRFDHYNTIQINGKGEVHVDDNTLDGIMGNYRQNESVNESEEQEYEVFYNRKKHIFKSSKGIWDAKQKAYKELRIPKSKQGLVAIQNVTSKKNQDFRFN